MSTGMGPPRDLRIGVKIPDKKVYGGMARRNKRGKFSQREINNLEMHGRRGVPITLPKVSILERDET